jgi:putative ABC transport system permease protein
LLIELAARDLWHDRKVSLCIVASLVAVIAPLLLLFGLKHGVVSQLNDELLSDPRNLEVRMLGNYDLAGGWFERLRAQPGVGFVIPLTRSLNTQADLQRDSQHFVANAEVIPTASGDPLIAAFIATKLLERSPVASAPARLNDLVVAGGKKKNDRVFAFNR